eukprot:342780_1
MENIPPPTQNQNVLLPSLLNLNRNFNGINATCNRSNNYNTPNQPPINFQQLQNLMQSRNISNGQQQLYQTQQANYNQQIQQHQQYIHGQQQHQSTYTQSSNNHQLIPGFLKIGGFEKSLLESTVPNNPDLDLFRYICNQYNIDGADLISIKVDYFKSTTGNMKPIVIPSSAIKPQINKDQDNDNNSLNILIEHTTKKVPQSIKQQAKQNKKEEKETTTPKLYKISDCDGLNRNQFLEILEWIINNKKISKRILESSHNILSGKHKVIGRIHEILKNNGMINVRKHASIQGQIDNKTKKYKTLKFKPPMDKDLYDNWIKYTTTFNKRIDMDKKQIISSETNESGSNDPSVNNNVLKRKLDETNTDSIETQPPQKKKKKKKK